jgi:imidazolonepropionase-like amidohydrolase
VKTRLALAVLASGVAAAVPLRADAPLVYAIKDARIVPVSGPPLEHGTVVIRDGLIQSVGEDVTPPGDARIVDGKGLTVYPGLIDASSEIGLPAAPAAGTPMSTPEEGSGTQRAFFRVADTVTDGGAAATSARQAGITTVLAVPNRGIFAGQSAVLNLNGDRATTLVRTRVAMHARFVGTGSREYPNALMGILAYVKQGLLDARRYREAWEIYRREPRQLRRPETDRALEALVPVVEGKLPLVLPGSTAPEVQRALRIGEELGVKVWISGATESGKVAAELQAQKVPVLLSLNFPARPAETDNEEALRLLKRRVEAPKCAGQLAQAGVPFVFGSAGASPQDFVKNAGRSVKAGLAPETALRALTLSAAELLGVDQQLGSIEPGKVANLVVTDGDLFNEKTRVRHVFVDGKLYAGASAAPAAAAPTAAGARGDR